MTGLFGPRQALVLGAALAFFLGLFVLLPLAMVVLSSVAQTWSMTPVPSAYTWRWFDAIRGADLDALTTSLVLALSAGAVATSLGTYAAYVIQRRRIPLPGVFDLLMMCPVALPSVVIGLALLLAFHRPPLALTESPAAVFLAHLVIVLPFAFRTVSAVLHEIDPRLEEAAVGLGASDAVAFFRVVLPLALPGVASGFILSFCLSMGELGATLMVYPPGFSTVTLAIYQLATRGFYYQGAALAVVLLVVAFAALLLLSWMATRTRRAARRLA
ncbi:MAG TPA: ABC transporter permease subunit [bacterium]|nr:ABC transporter permease subunit [bacterium]